MIQFACPGCETVYSVDDAKAGKTGQCPKCRAQFIIPSADTPSARGADGPPPPSTGGVRLKPVPESPSPPAESTPPPLTPPASPSPPSDPNEVVEVAPCPTCSARLSVLVGDLGSEVECPHCRRVFTALRPGEPPPLRDESKPRSGGSADLGDLLDQGANPSSQRRRRQERDDDEDDRPARSSRRRRRSWDDDEDDDDRPSRRSRSRSRSGGSRPSNLGAVGGILLGGGIYSLLFSGLFVLGTGGCGCIWPGVYYELVVGILAIIRGSRLLQVDDLGGPPRTHCILMIICLVNLDIITMILGIVGLVLLNNEDVTEYYERKGF